MGRSRKTAIKDFERRFIQHCISCGHIKGRVDRRFRILPQALKEQAKLAGFPAINLLTLRPDLVEHFPDGSLKIWDVKRRCQAMHVGQVVLYKVTAQNAGHNVRGVGILCFTIDHVAEAAAEELDVEIVQVNPEDLPL